MAEVSQESEVTERNVEIQERRKKSTIWLFFVVDINDKTKAVCQVCREKVSRGGSVPKTFNTSNLRKHLKAHPEKYKELIEREKEKDESQSSKNTDTQKQVTLEALIEKRKPYSIDHPRAKAISFRIAEMIAVDLQPFSVVEDPGFCRLMKELEPRYSLPSRRYFSDVIIPSIHVNVNHLVTQLLSSTNFVSLTTDIWSSDNSHHSFMSLVAHFIVDSTMEKKDLMLSCWKFDESHTGENISSNILSHIQSWDIEEKLVCVVRDNAANMIAGMRVANIPSLSCLAHSLQLIIKDGIFQQPSVQQLLISARSIIGYYHRSNTAFHTFQQIQEQLGLPKHLLIQDVSTRWNSSFYMLQRLIEQKRAITVTSTECQPPSELRAQQWTLAEKVVKILVVFEEATREVSGNYASASVIIPIINTLKRALTIEEDDEGIMRMKRGMLKSLEDRYADVEQNSLCALATVLDPRFKLRVFSSAGNAAHARMLLTTECEEVLSNSVSSRSSPNHQPQCKRQKSEKTTSSTLWNIFNEMMDEPEESSLDGDVPVGYTAEIMVEMYLKEPIQTHCVDPLNYWKEKKAVWNGLVNLACKYLSIPPSSASSERLFSSAADIISQERNRLLPQKAEMLLFLKKNLPVFDYIY